MEGEEGAAGPIPKKSADGRQRHHHRHLFNNYNSWKHKLRENCYQRVREDRERLLWKMRTLPPPQSLNPIENDYIKSAFQDIVSAEMVKMKDSTLNDSICISAPIPGEANDVLWEYDGHTYAYQGDCEEILLEMQRIFYQDLSAEPTKKETQILVETWEDEEDDYLAQAAYEHMQLKDKQLLIWCPICKHGELQENHHLIYCNSCEFQLNKGDEVNLELLRGRLEEVHAQHLDRGCRLKPRFCIETRFNITALYILCAGCNIFEVVL